MLATEIPLNATEVKSTNITQAMSELQNEGFTFRNDSNLATIDYNFLYTSPNQTIKITFRIFHNTTVTSLRIIDYSCYPEGQIGLEKDIVISKANKIANACKFSIDWSNVQWSISYQN